MDVIIIGGGVAGLSCALYTSKAGMETVVIDQQTSQLGSVKAVFNFPGFAQGIAGEDWLLAAREQVTTAGATLTLGKATELKTTNRPYTVITEDGRSFTAPYVVLAVNLGFELLTKHDYALLVNEHVPSRKIRHIEGIGYDGKTAQPGIYAAGLIANVPSQSVIAAGQGAFVGVQIASEFLQKPFMWHD
ncbi:NAD(P)/FAD-dependent oxidoreductase [Sulfoacidibacillus ferrooxidans]|uniref:Ferredoxin--NADP reductase n=1 Tax=Sulfoacidibacillus ferrooxidans TaxID=2005001 RepID=A0A9X2ACT6_9BACL|nr:FAD-dependent oxidoreductase [Sulfoacidibacillus ferrooxidans]MCI0181811.1 Ferredoxin--NADP reductase [Sulfoacidibacillus ferrooxidans]